MPAHEDEDYEDGEILEEGEEPEPTAAPVNGHSIASLLSADPVVEKAPETDVKPVQNAAEGGLLPLPPVAPRSQQAHRPAEPPMHAPPRRPGGYGAPAAGGYRTPSPSLHDGPRKRMHSEMDDNSSNGQRYSSTGDRHTQPRHSHSTSSDQNNNSAPRKRDDHEAERYVEGLILRFPRQVVASNVLLGFSQWIEAFSSRTRKRLDVDDLRDIVLNVLGQKTSVSPFLMESLLPNHPPPTKVCVVLLGNLHPVVLQRCRADLPFFDGCSSVPCMLSNASQDKRREAPLPQLMYRFPKPPVDTKELPTDELFYGHELTFLMNHSVGWNDEVVLQPTGVFTRKSQPQGGTWELDGDLLHLKWRLQRNKADEADGLVAEDEMDDDSFILDVLVAEDASMHYFVTEAATDKTYAHEAPDHMMTKRQRMDSDKSRSIRMSLVKATLANVARDESGSIIRQSKEVKKSVTNGDGEDEPMKAEFDVRDLKLSDFEPYVLSPEELAHHLFPVDVDAEQAALMKETRGGTRDVYVKTRQRQAASPEATASDPSGEPVNAHPAVYALDCEMCETDIGMELTRITVVNTLGEVVYDQLVKPRSTIINYHTQFSGITEEILASTRYILADVQRDLLEKFLFEDTILVGHSLSSDLRALRIVHLKIADTAILYPHERGFPFRASLKMLTKTYLGKDIQTKLQDGHDSAEDARAAMELLIQKVRRGPLYGIPDVGFFSTAYDTLPDKLAAREKRLTMLKYEHKLSGEWVYEEKKAWELYASGHHQDNVHDPSSHAKAVQKKEASVENAYISDVSHSGFDSSALLEGVKAATKRGDDVCWLEINQVSDQAAAREFVLKHDKWMDRQETYCTEVDTLLRQLRDDVLEKGTLLMVVPQGDLGVLRYVKALQTRSRWNDVTPEKEIVSEIREAVSDAFRGVWDSCAFFTQK